MTSYWKRFMPTQSSTENFISIFWIVIGVFCQKNLSRLLAFPLNPQPSNFCDLFTGYLVTFCDWEYTFSSVLGFRLLFGDLLLTSGNQAEIFSHVWSILGPRDAQSAASRPPPYVRYLFERSLRLLCFQFFQYLQKLLANNAKFSFNCCPTRPVWVVQ